MFWGRSHVAPRIRGLEILGSCVRVNSEASPSSAMDVRSMSAEELRAAIDEQRRQREANGARLLQLEAETRQALERQRLRNQLRKPQKRRRIDKDEHAGDTSIREKSIEKRPAHVKDGASTKFADMVLKAEYVWRIEGFCWMKCGLEQQG